MSSSSSSAATGAAATTAAPTHLRTRKQLSPDEEERLKTIEKCVDDALSGNLEDSLARQPPRVSDVLIGQLMAERNGLKIKLGLVAPLIAPGTAHSFFCSLKKAFSHLRR